VPKSIISTLGWLVLIALIAGLDQISKQLVLTHLASGFALKLSPYLNLSLTYNTGAAFSFLINAGGWQRWFFIGTSVVIGGWLFVWLLRTPKTTRLLPAALSLIIGGALGNLIDRVRYGYVVDFIDAHYATWHWPVFNIADSAICIGAVLLGIHLLFEKEKPA